MKQKNRRKIAKIAAIIGLLAIILLWPYLTLKQQQTRFILKSDMTLLLDEHTQVVLNKARTP